MARDQPSSRLDEHKRSRLGASPGSSDGFNRLNELLVKQERALQGLDRSAEIEDPQMDDAEHEAELARYARSKITLPKKRDYSRGSRGRSPQAEGLERRLKVGLIEGQTSPEPRIKIELNLPRAVRAPDTVNPRRRSAERYTSNRFPGGRNEAPTNRSR